MFFNCCLLFLVLEVERISWKVLQSPGNLCPSLLPSLSHSSEWCLLFKSRGSPFRVPKEFICLSIQSTEIFHVFGDAQFSDSKFLVRRKTWKTTSTGVHAPTQMFQTLAPEVKTSFAEVCFYVSKVMVLPLLRTVSLSLCLQDMSLPLGHGHTSCLLGIELCRKKETPGGFYFFIRSLYMN